MNERTRRKRHIIRLRRQGIVVTGFDPAWFMVMASYGLALSESFRRISDSTVTVLDQLNATLRALGVDKALHFELVPAEDPNDTREIPLLPGWKEKFENVGKPELPWG